ncbi:MAG TPA: phosphoribosyltransferase family protein [Planctomycetota bacterium]|nr:phosphoribosyltransferase family protein [Planctomycetota bacterium]
MKAPRNLRLLFTAEEIHVRLGRVAREVAKKIDPSERPLAIVVLQGGFIFAADLLRRLPPDFPIDVAFLRCQSYGAGTRSSGRVLLLQDIDPEVDLRGRTVLLLDDILDTGLTMNFLVTHLKRRGAARVCVCVLLHRRRAPRAPKRLARRLKPDFAAFTIGPEFVVGYGLDHDGKYRHLPMLAALKLPRAKK